MDENWKMSGWSENVKIEKERRAIREGVSPDKEKRGKQQSPQGGSLADWLSGLRELTSHSLYGQHLPGGVLDLDLGKNSKGSCLSTPHGFGQCPMGVRRPTFYFSHDPTVQVFCLFRSSDPNPLRGLPM